MLRVVSVPSRLPSAFWVSVAMVAIVSSPSGGSGTIPDDAKRKGPGAAVTGAQRRGTPVGVPMAPAPWGGQRVDGIGDRGPDKGVKEKGMVFEAKPGGDASGHEGLIETGGGRRKQASAFLEPPMRLTQSGRREVPPTATYRHKPAA